MRSFKQYLLEQMEQHPHYRGSKTDSKGIVTHTFVDNDLGVRTTLSTHPSIPNTAYWGFQTKNHRGVWTQKDSSEKKWKGQKPKGRTASSMGHISDFAKRHGITTIQYQTNRNSPNEEIFQRMWPRFSTGVELKNVDSNPLRSV